MNLSNLDNVNKLNSYLHRLNCLKNEIEIEISTLGGFHCNELLDLICLSITEAKDCLENILQVKLNDIDIINALNDCLEMVHSMRGKIRDEDQCRNVCDRVIDSLVKCTVETEDCLTTLGVEFDEDE